jgi:hypothetical protein
VATLFQLNCATASMCSGLKGSDSAGRDEEIAAGIGTLNYVGENLLSLLLERTILFNRGASESF